MVLPGLHVLYTVATEALPSVRLPEVFPGAERWGVVLHDTYCITHITRTFFLQSRNSLHNVCTNYSTCMYATNPQEELVAVHGYIYAYLNKR